MFEIYSKTIYYKFCNKFYFVYVTCVFCGKYIFVWINIRIKMCNEETLSLFKEGQGYLRFLRREKLLCRNMTNNIFRDIGHDLIVIKFYIWNFYVVYIVSYNMRRRWWNETEVYVNIVAVKTMLSCNTFPSIDSIDIIPL